MIEGRVMTLGRDINTDLITSSKHLGGHGTPEERLRYTLYDYDPEFGVKYKPGIILVTDSNFGCGSSRESAPSAFKQLGVPAIISESFARIFYRSSINIGLPIFELTGAIKMFKDDDIARIEPETGIITNVTTGKSVTIPPMPPEIQKIIDMGGLIPYTEHMLRK